MKYGKHRKWKGILRRAYVEGFERACGLIYGTNTRWHKDDVHLRVQVLRRVAGKKR